MTGARREWAEAALARLCLNELGLTIGGLRRMQPKDDAVRRFPATASSHRRRTAHSSLCFSTAYWNM